MREDREIKEARKEMSKKYFEQVRNRKSEIKGQDEKIPLLIPTYDVLKKMKDKNFYPRPKDISKELDGDVTSKSTSIKMKELEKEGLIELFKKTTKGPKYRITNEGMKYLEKMGYG